MGEGELEAKCRQHKGNHKRHGNPSGHNLGKPAQQSRLEPDVRDHHQEPEELWVGGYESLHDIGVAGEFLACLVPASD